MADVPELATCRFCGYALRHLTTPRCPECGRAFDPDCDETYRLPGDFGKRVRRTLAPIASARRRLNAFGTATLVMATMLATQTGLLWLRHEGGDLGCWPWQSAMWLIVLARLVYGTACPRGRRSPRGWRAGTVGLLVLTLAMPVLFFHRSMTCPHGTISMYGPVGYAISDSGGPCRNLIPSRTIYRIRGNLYLVIE